MAVLVPNTPKPGGINTDSGVFLYIGWRILDGEIPYRDMWDHKPPLIYYIDAAGLFVGQGSAWGVWAIEFLSVYAAAVLGFIVIKRAFGPLPALFGSIAWLRLLVPLLQGGNFTEEYALPLQFAALYLYLAISTKGVGPYCWRGYALGATGALAFLLRQNLVGVWIAIVLHLLFTRFIARDWRGLIRITPAIAMGAISPLLLVIMYFAASGVLGSFWDAAFTFNLVNSQATPRVSLQVIFTGIRLTSPSWISIIALAGWGGAVFTRVFSRNPSEYFNRLLDISIIGLPAVLVMATLSGERFPHYYMAWLPMFAIFAAFSFSLIVRGASYLERHALASRRGVGPQTRKARVSRRRRVKAVANPFVMWFQIAALLAMSFQPVRVIINQTDERQHVRPWISDAASYVKSNSAEDDFVLMWGGEPAVNFEARRRSPTRFIYQNRPLYTRGYQSVEDIDAFLRDIMVNKPLLIIDTSVFYRVVPLGLRDVQEWKDADYALPEMQKVLDYVHSHYKIVGTTGSGLLPVYRYVTE